MQVDNVQRLTSAQLFEVLALVDAATRQDTVPPLSEQVLLAVRGERATGNAPHFLAYDGTHLAGYAHLERGGPHRALLLAPTAPTAATAATAATAPTAPTAATGEVVVDPGHRRKGFGARLIQALEDVLTRDTHSEQEPLRAGSAATTLQLWAHGHLEGARALALRDGYSTVRELWQMCRTLRSNDGPGSATGAPSAPGSLPDLSLPEGFTTRHFVVAQDEDAWLRVNARAFVDHPEQGRMTRADLDRRIAEPWFDARGFILIEDTHGPVPVLAASHWTKVVPAEDHGVSRTKDETPGVGDDPKVSPTEDKIPGVGDDPKVSPTQGEVYVVGVDPAYQGLGLGRAVTILGLAHLRERGVGEATLYVEADNQAAIATYSGLGFARCGVDTMYSRTVHSPV